MQKHTMKKSLLFIIIIVIVFLRAILQGYLMSLTSHFVTSNRMPGSAILFLIGILVSCVYIGMFFLSVRLKTKYNYLPEISQHFWKTISGILLYPPHIIVQSFAGLTGFQFYFLFYLGVLLTYLSIGYFAAKIKPLRDFN